MALLYTIIAWLVVATGAVHTAMTPMFFRQFSASAVWFAGAGLSLVFLGFLNYAAINAGVPSLFITCIIANTLGLGLGVAAIITMREVQGYLVTLFVALMLACSLLVRFDLVTL